MKIAIAGKMGSGKSWIANLLVNEYGFYKTSFAKRVKELVVELFDTHEKNRELLIKFASYMRQIDSEVWIRQTLKDIDSQKNQHVVIDDLRLGNEYRELKKQGWFFIKLNIDEEMRVQRIKDTYLNDSESHLKHQYSITENDVCVFPNSCFDLVIEDTHTVKETIEKILNDRINSRVNEF